MESLKIAKNENEYYKLQVNDNGDYIEFDLFDINLPKRILDASKNIRKFDIEYNIELSELIDKKLSEEEKLDNIIEIESKYDKFLRKEFDSFLGENACQKIFGDSHRYGQFIDLMEALQPHFNKMKINIAGAKRKLANKYKSEVGKDTI